MLSRARELLSFDGAVVVVTGGSSGIGRGVALLFAELGATLCIFDLTEAAGAEPPTAEVIVAAGGTAYFSGVDVRDPGALREVVGRLDRERGGADVLVNSAGVVLGGGGAHVTEISDEGWERVISVNLSGTFYASREIASSMVSRGRGGRIINIASISGLFGTQLSAAYGASKGGVVSLTRHMAMDLAARQITVNAIAPGATVTPMIDPASELYRRTVSTIPLGRLAQPADIAGAAVFLASHLADHVTGQVLVVDGGLTAGLRWRADDVVGS